MLGLFAPLFTSLILMTSLMSNNTAIGSPQFNSDDGDTQDVLMASSFGPPNSELRKSRKKNIEPSRSSMDSPNQRDQIQYFLGLGANIPDLFPIEGYARFNSFIALRLFYVPTIPFHLRVEMPRDELTSKGGIVVENPDLNIKFDCRYGPQYGAEFVVFPWLGSFYMTAGLSHRQLEMKGGVASNLILKSKDSGTSINTNTDFGIQTDASTSQLVFRTTMGWMWNVWADRGYFNLTLIGITIPKKTHSSINVEATITNPNASDPSGSVPDAITETKAAKEAEMEDKALDAMKPVERLILPIIGLSGGFRF